MAKNHVLTLAEATHLFAVHWRTTESYQHFVDGSMSCESGLLTEGQSKLELDRVTRLLCTLCERLEDAHLFRDVASADLGHWWGTHIVQNQERQREQQPFFY